MLYYVVYLSRQLGLFIFYNSSSSSTPSLEFISHQDHPVNSPSFPISHSSFPIHSSTSFIMTFSHLDRDPHGGLPTGLVHDHPHETVLASQCMSEGHRSLRFLIVLNMFYFWKNLSNTPFFLVFHSLPFHHPSLVRKCSLIFFYQKSAASFLPFFLKAKPHCFISDNWAYIKVIQFLRILSYTTCIIIYNNYYVFFFFCSAKEAVFPPYKTNV